MENKNEIVVDYKGIVITKTELDALHEATPKINNTTATMKMYPEIDIKLAILAKQLQHIYKLPNKNGINRTNLTYLLLKQALKNITI